MKLHQHKIQQHVYDISFEGKEKTSRAFQMKFSNLFRSRMAHVIDREFSDFCGEDEFIRIKSLEIDLGNLYLHELESTIETRLRESLREGLKRARLSIQSSSGIKSNTHTETEHSLELIKYFLVNGQLPWWAHRSDQFSVEKPFNMLLDNSRVQIKTLLRRIGRAENVRKRMVKQFKEATLIKIISKYQPSDVEFIRLYIFDLRKTHDEQPVLNTTKEKLNEVLWELVLGYIFEDRGTRFNRKEFLRWNLIRLASMYKVSYQFLLTRLLKSVQKVEMHFKFKSEFSTLISEISEEDYPEFETEFNAPEESRNILLEFENFLLFRDLTFLETINEIWKSLFRHHRKEVSALLSLYIRRKSIRKRLISEFSEEELSEVVISLDSEHSEFILSYVDTTTGVTQEQVRKVGIQKEFRASIWDFILEYLAYHAGTRFNKKEFLRTNLIQLSIRHRIEYGELLDFFYSLIKPGRLKIQESDSLPGLIEELRNEQQKKGSEFHSDFVEASGLIQFYDSLFELKRYLNSGVTSLSKRERQILYEHIFNSPEKKGKLFFRDLNNQEHVLMRIGVDMNATLFKKIVKSVLPKESHKVLGFLNRIQNSSSFIFPGSGKRLSNILREYYVVFLQQVLSRGNIDLKKLVQSFHYIATVKYGIDGDVFNKDVEQSFGSVYSKLASSDRKKNEFKYLALQGSTNKRKLVKSLEQDSIWEILFYYAEGGEVLFVNGKKSSFESVFALLINDHFEVVKSFFKQLSRKPSSNQDLKLSKFKEKSLMVINKKVVHEVRKAEFNEIITSQTKIKEQNNLQIKKEEILVNEIAVILEGKSSSIKTESELIRYLEFVYQNNRQVLVYYLKSRIPVKSVMSKWVKLFSERVLIRLMAFVQNKSIDDEVLMIDWILSEWRDSHKKHLSRNRTKTLKWDIIFQTHLKGISLKNDEKFFDLIFSKILKQDEMPYYEEFKKKKEFINLLLNSSHGLRIKMKYRKKLERFALNIKSERKVLQDIIDGTSKSIDKTKNEKHIDKVYKKELRLTGEDEQLIFIENAGLVILGAYLPQFFKRLELLDDKKFKNQESIFKAIHMLQYLVTGTLENPEYDLTLNKILCGLDPTEPIPYSVQTSNKDLELADSLLEIAVERWSVLGKTTVNGFRESFLKREGKLEFGDEAWKLTVEVKGYDMLLDQLPWSISILMHAWMQKRIEVEWR